jgi:hypothetical protein
MSGGKHTPGPWWYDAANNAVYDTAGNVIIVYEGQLQFKSDGPLIAAAPDLLDALKRLLEFVMEHTDPTVATMEFAAEYERSRAAIAKAEGGAA